MRFAESVFAERFGITRHDLENYLGEALSQGGDYADLYFEYLLTSSISIDESMVKSATQGVSMGLGSVRLMMQGRGKGRGPGAATVMVGAILMAGALSCGGAQAAEIVPHHAVYSMSLGATHGDAGVTGAGGTMAYQWGETYDGWTVEQRYRLEIGYAESSNVSISSNFVTWEAKDALKYRFNQKETRNGTDNDEIRGEAKLDGPGKGGTVSFEKPEAKTLKLPAGTLFPSAHTIFLIDKAKAGENFMSTQIFDGAQV